MKIKTILYDCLVGPREIEVTLANYFKLANIDGITSYYTNDLNTILSLNPDKKETILEEYNKYLEENNK